MAIINYDGISGINSITSVGSGVKFYDTTGAASFTITPSGNGGASFGQALSIDSAGRLGIGTQIPSAVINVRSSAAELARFTNTGSNGGDWEVKLGGGGFEDRKFMLTDRFGGTDNVRVSVDSSGRVTIPSQPAFMAGNTSSTHTTNVGSVLDFNTEANTGFDVGNNFDTTNYRFTAPVAGTYAFSSNIYQQNGGTLSSFCWRKNGTQLTSPGGDNLIFFKASSINGDSTMCSNILLRLAVNDYIDIVVRTGSSNVQWYGGHSWIMGYLIG